ncbi:PorV/PorQ family protein [Candidatus Saganbacteria bacterium]|nr:PorV/PorQ family protein [Candidatus Saganbacteria bacterium]
MREKKLGEGFRLLIRNSILGFITAIIFSSVAFASSQAGVDIAVLNAGVGARPMGMGGAFTSIADNADSPYWNPAGLSNITSQEITTMQTKLSTDTDHYYISYATKLGKGTLGISWIQVSLGNITQTTTTDAFNEVITTNVFSYFSNAYLLAYGLPITPNISFGMTAKYLTSDMFGIAGGQAYGYSFSPAFLIKARGWSFGAKVDELANEQKWETGTAEKVPPKARVGISFMEPRGLPAGSTVAIDVAQTLRSSYSPEFAFGYEYKKGDLALRAGLLDSNLTAGAGFRSGKASLDYAYVQQSSVSRNNVHRISLSGKW